MANTEPTKTELRWPGKYNADGTPKVVPRLNLPFQVIETINESRATRESKNTRLQATLFDVWEGKEGDTFEAGWRNKLIWGDNLLVMNSLLEKFAGKIDLIYIDPPFLAGRNFKHGMWIGERDAVVEESKTESLLQVKAYYDSWGRGIDSYLEMLWSRLQLCRDLLSPRGALYVHLGPGISHYVQTILDEIFGASNGTEIVWKRTTAHSDSSIYATVHDYIFFYWKSDEHIWNQQYVPHDPDYVKSKYVNKEKNGRLFMLDNITSPNPRPNMMYEWRGHSPPALGWRYSKERMAELHAEGRIWYPDDKSKRPRLKRYLDESPGVPVSGLWLDINPVNSQANEDTGYDTQKPQALLERIIKTSSNKGDLVADFFCGSGTSMAVAEKLDRRWIGADLGRFAIHTARKRLLDIDGCRPLEVLNIGKYERQYWQGITFSNAKGKPAFEQALYEYLAFVLKLYGAQPLAGMSHLHGKKGRAMIHIGAVDAPVTIAEIDAAVNECVKLKQGELHVLGWEWEMGLYDLMVDASKKKNVKLSLFQIPREVMEHQATDKGDVHFFELAYLQADIKQTKKLTAQITLRDFVIPHTDFIPEEVRSKVKKWSDYIDYWAADWDFQNDTFMQGWVAFRTRNERKLSLASDAHTYEKPGEYRIVVKVIDVFGNDTSQAFDVGVK
jgi:adenine-specific DNA-methyltransferase